MGGRRNVVLDTRIEEWSPGFIVLLSPVTGGINVVFIFVDSWNGVATG